MDKLIFPVRKLLHIYRCSTYRRCVDEDVAQHSYMVTMMAMLVADELNAEGLGVNVEKVMRSALLHDVCEVLTGDIIFPMKHHNSAVHNAIKETEHVLLEDFFLNLPVKFMRYKNQILNAKDGLEGAIVAVCDMAELAVYCFEEVSFGNVSMKDIFFRAVRIVEQNKICASSKLLQELMEFLKKLDFTALSKLQSLDDAKQEAFA